MSSFSDTQDVSGRAWLTSVGQVLALGGNRVEGRARDRDAHLGHGGLHRDVLLLLHVGHRVLLVAARCWCEVENGGGGGGKEEKAIG